MSAIAEGAATLGLLRSRLNLSRVEERAFFGFFEFESDLVRHLARSQSEVATVLPDVNKSLLQFLPAVEVRLIELDV